MDGAQKKEVLTSLSLRRQATTAGCAEGQQHPGKSPHNRDRELTFWMSSNVFWILKKHTKLLCTY